MELPKPLFDRYAAAHDFHTIASVQIRDRDGAVHGATLMDDNGPLIVHLEDSALTSEAIAAIRKAPGYLIG